MALALANLDTGLFYDKGRWTVDYKSAQLFPDHQSVWEVAVQNRLTNFVAVLVSGEPPRVRGFFKVTNAHSN
jgi:hypothetical protein